MDQKLRDWQIPGPPIYEGEGIFNTYYTSQVIWWPVWWWLLVVADALTYNGDILVYFHAESLNGFKPPEEWTQVVRQTHKEKRPESQE